MKRKQELIWNLQVTLGTSNDSVEHIRKKVPQPAIRNRTLSGECIYPISMVEVLLETTKLGLCESINDYRIMV